MPDAQTPADDVSRRTWLAAERTWLAWWRTGVAAGAVALAPSALARRDRPRRHHPLSGRHGPAVAPLPSVAGTTARGMRALLSVAVAGGTLGVTKTRTSRLEG